LLNKFNSFSFITLNSIGSSMGVTGYVVFTKTNILAEYFTVAQ
jgi:hypothetical protein